MDEYDEYNRLNTNNDHDDDKIIEDDDDKIHCNRMVKWFFVYFFIILIFITAILLETVEESKSPPMKIDHLWPENGLDVGIYWFNYNSTRSKQIESEENIYFDVKKKILLYCHGWSINAVKHKHRDITNFQFNDPKYGLDIDLAKSWLDDDWNVGFFYWNQLADERFVSLSEGKIWSINTHTKMRWKMNNLTFTNENSPTVPVGELFFIKNI